MQKWIYFCCTMMGHGFEVWLYEARRTYSKYITVVEKDKTFRVRFSDHAPIARREREGDCDFFVGRTNFVITTTEDAIDATLRFFGRL